SCWYRLSAHQPGQHQKLDRRPRSINGSAEIYGTTMEVSAFSCFTYTHLQTCLNTLLRLLHSSSLDRVSLCIKQFSRLVLPYSPMSASRPMPALRKSSKTPNAIWP